MTVNVAIVVCTYHRPDLLRKCLSGFANQTVPENAAFSVYVVDNSDDGTAKPVVDWAAKNLNFAVRWVQAHPANISVARNKGIQVSDEPIVAFIDDDQVCQPGWFEAVVAGVQQYPADVWFGSVTASFEDGSNSSPEISTLFSRNVPLSAGAPLYALGPNKTPNIALATNNSIFRRATTLTEPEPFNIKFGRTGGEDYELVCRLQRCDMQLAWLPQANASEFVPHWRTEASYLRRRFFAGGQHFAAGISGSGPKSQLRRWIVRGKAAVQLGLMVLQLPIIAMAGKSKQQDFSFRIASVLGKLSIGGLYEFYGQNHVPSKVNAELPEQKA